MSQLPTVKIKASSQRGWRIINASDFDASAHELWNSAPPAEEAEDPIPASSPAPYKRGPGRPRKAQG